MENKHIFYLILVAIFFYLFFGVFKVHDLNENLKKSFNRDINENYNSIVIEKGKDKWNRNTPYFILNNKSKSHIDSLLYEKIEIGDTLRKSQGDTILQIIKKDTTLYFNFQDIFNYYDSIYKEERYK